MVGSVVKEKVEGDVPGVFVHKEIIGKNTLAVSAFVERVRNVIQVAGMRPGRVSSRKSQRFSTSVT